DDDEVDPDGVPWDEYITFDANEDVKNITDNPPKYHPPENYTLPTIRAPATATRMQ
ncbi:hypothetical protein BGZ58_004441, partial [Dissophora ornata]